jgi:NAD-dependent deacetylase
MISLERIASMIKNGDVVAFCGSGLSAESGIPTFRGEGGLWEKYDPNFFVTEDGLLSRLVYHPHELRNFISEFYDILLAARPGVSHYVLAQMEKKGYIKGVITQNVDDLHYQAGSKNVVELHGNAYSFICRKCGFQLKKNPQEWRHFVEDIKRLERGRDILKEMLSFAGRCPNCKKHNESDIVLFGQDLPDGAVRRSYELLRKAKIVLCVGSSGVVYPAAYFPVYAKENGSIVINVNPEKSPLDEVADFTYHQKAGEFFSGIEEFLKA